MLEDQERMQQGVVEEGQRSTRMGPIVPSSQPVTSSGDAVDRSSRLGIVMALLALILSVGAIWVAWDQQHRLNVLEQQLAVVVKQPSLNADAILEPHLQGIRDRLEAIERDVIALKEKAAEPALTPKEPPAQTATTEAKVSTPPPSARSVPVQGGWAVVIASVRSLEAAKAEQARLTRMGLDSRIAATTVNGSTRYRVYIGGFSSRDAAKAKAKALAARHQFKGLWVTRTE